MLVLSPIMVAAQATYTVSGNNYTSVSKARTKSEPKKTTYTYTDNKGKTYPIYVGSTGSCFVIKTSSKTGKEYRMYLGEEISRDVCRKMNITYNGKKK